MILVTGGTGLVGSHLLRDLAEAGQRVRAIYRSPESIEVAKKVFLYKFSSAEAEALFEQVEWLKADITDVPSLEKAFENVELVYHCAAIISLGHSNSSPLRKVNIEGTANIVNYCIKNNIKKLCFVSSIATLDPMPGEKLITEESHWNKEIDHDMYAITKYGAEMEVWRASQEGVPVIIVNPGVILGPGNWKEASGKIFSKVYQGLNYHFPKVTGFVGVWDVVRLMQELMESSIINENFILVSENRSFKEIFEWTAQAFNKPTPQKELKPWMIKLAWMGQEFSRIFSGRKGQLTSDSSEKLFQKHFYSSEKLQQNLNYNFEPIEKVINQTALAFQKDLAN